MTPRPARLSFAASHAFEGEDRSRDRTHINIDAEIRNSYWIRDERHRARGAGPESCDRTSSRPPPDPVFSMHAMALTEEVRRSAQYRRRDLGSFHDGDMAVFQAMARMASRSRCAAPGRRRGKLRLHRRAIRRPPCATPRQGSSAMAMKMLEDIDKDTVDFIDKLRRLAARAELILSTSSQALLVNGAIRHRRRWRRHPRPRYRRSLRRPHLLCGDWSWLEKIGVEDLMASTRPRFYRRRRSFRTRSRRRVGLRLRHRPRQGPALRQCRIQDIGQGDPHPGDRASASDPNSSTLVERIGPD